MDNLTENKYTSEDLKTMQAFPMSRKIQIAQTRVIEWYQKWDGQVVVSFSGGKDSTVLLHLVRQIYPNVEAVYVDTGLEYPEIKQFVKQHENVTIVRPEMSYRQVIEKYGYPIISKEVAGHIEDARNCPNGKIANRFVPGNTHDEKYGGRYSIVKWAWLKDSDIPITRKCCSIMKKEPLKKYEHQSGKKSYVATMACESQQRKTAWLKNGCNAFDAKRPHSMPLSIWTEQDVLQYILDYDLPIASVYGAIVRGDDGKLTTTGCKRTGCVFCGFGAHIEKEPNRFQRLQVTHPKLWEYCMKDFDKGGLGMKAVLENIGVPTGDYSCQMTLNEVVNINTEEK